jgi:hypothetical protein
LTFNSSNGESLIVENKVKSIASPEQLKEYSGKVKDKDKEHTSFLLLSLIRPDFVPSNDALFEVGETSWHFLCYSEIANLLEPAIASISEINKYHGELVSDYLAFVRSLVGIASHVKVDLDNEKAHFFDRQKRKMLREIRLHDLMDKMRYAQLAQRIKEILTAEGCCVLAKDEFFARDAPGVFKVDSALYHSEGLCQFHYLAKGGENRVELGVMFQGNQINVFVSGTRDSAIRVAEELMSPKKGGRVWFDLARIPSDSAEMPAKAKFNQFKGKGRILLYRYKKIAQISPKCLVDVLVSYARSIRDAEDTIQEQIAAVVRSG